MIEIQLVGMYPHEAWCAYPLILPEYGWSPDGWVFDPCLSFGNVRVHLGKISFSWRNEVPHRPGARSIANVRGGDSYEDMITYRKRSFRFDPRLVVTII